MSSPLEPKNVHYSVLKTEVLEALNVQPDGIYLDATAGRGGHLAAILSKLGPNGRIIGLDQDLDAVAFCQNRFQADPRVKIVHTNFINAPTQFVNQRFMGILMDLGVSSPQLDNPERGFSYHQDGPLDMRMNQEQPLKAWNIVNEFPAERLEQIFRRYGEIPHSRTVVQQIIRHRPVDTTGQLVQIIQDALPPQARVKKGGHPEKVYFQALRIYVNQELTVLEQVLPKLASMLEVHGVLCVITFHSLEEKIVRQIFRELSQNHLPAEIPLQETWQMYQMAKIQRPSEAELVANSRSASAKLFALKRLKEKSDV